MIIANRRTVAINGMNQHVAVQMAMGAMTVAAAATNTGMNLSASCFTVIVAV